ncbi:MAG: cytochrome c-type biogenesis protein [Acidimicrobiales bacterium]
MSAATRRLAWVGLAVAAIALLVVAGLDQGGVETDAEQIQRLSESYACPVCNGESVAESNAAVAATIRQFISDQVSAGATELEIRDRLVQTYTAEVLLNPPAEGITTLIWVLPVMFVVLGSVGVAAAITRSQGANRDASDEDRELLAKAQQDRS